MLCFGFSSKKLLCKISFIIDYCFNQILKQNFSNPLDKQIKLEMAKLHQGTLWVFNIFKCTSFTEKN